MVVGVALPSGNDYDARRPPRDLGHDAVHTYGLSWALCTCRATQASSQRNLSLSLVRMVPGLGIWILHTASFMRARSDRRTVIALHPTTTGLSAAAPKLLCSGHPGGYCM